MGIFRAQWRSLKFLTVGALRLFLVTPALNPLGAARALPALARPRDEWLPSSISRQPAVLGRLARLS